MVGVVSFVLLYPHLPQERACVCPPICPGSWMTPSAPPHHQSRGPSSSPGCPTCPRGWRSACSPHPPTPPVLCPCLPQEWVAVVVSLTVPVSPRLSSPSPAHPTLPGCWSPSAPGCHWPMGSPLAPKGRWVSPSAPGDDNHCLPQGWMVPLVSGGWLSLPIPKVPPCRRVPPCTPEGGGP